MLKWIKSNKNILVVAAIILVLNGGMRVSASSVSFSGFRFTTTPNYTAGSVAATKAKSDNEQKYYYTITAQNGLGSGGSNRYVLAESLLGGSHVSQPVKISTSSMSGSNTYYSYTSAGSVCSFYIYGDDLNSRAVSVTLSGRYSS